MGSRRRVIPSIGTQASVLCVQQVTKTDTVHRIGQDGHCGSSLVPHAPLLKLLSGSTCLVMYPVVEKKLSVKADLAIYSYVLDVFG